MIEQIVGDGRWRARSPSYLEISRSITSSSQKLRDEDALCLSHGKWHTRLLELIISLRQSFYIFFSFLSSQIIYIYAIIELIYNCIKISKIFIYCSAAIFS